MYYFGYCTFLNPVEMKRFFPNGKIVSKGYVQNCSIAFCASGERTDRGWCHLDLTPSAWGKRALGIVIEHGPEQFVDYPDFKRIAITVHGEDGKVYDCWTWILDNPGMAMKPPKAYWNHVSTGLKHYEFSEEDSKNVIDVYDAAAECPEQP